MKLYPMALVTTVTLSALSVPALATPLIQIHEARLKTEYQFDYLPYETAADQPNIITFRSESTSNNARSSLNSQYGESVYIRNRGTLDSISAQANITYQDDSSGGDGLGYSLVTFADNGVSSERFDEEGYKYLGLEVGSEAYEAEKNRHEKIVSDGYSDVFVSNTASIFLDFTVLNDDSAYHKWYDNYPAQFPNEQLLDITDEPIDVESAFYNELGENSIFWDAGTDGIPLKKDRRYQLSISLSDYQYDDHNAHFDFKINGSFANKPINVNTPSTLALLMSSLFCLVRLRKRYSTQA